MVYKGWLDSALKMRDLHIIFQSCNTCEYSVSWLDTVYFSRIKNQNAEQKHLKNRYKNERSMQKLNRRSPTIKRSYYSQKTDKLYNNRFVKLVIDN